MTLKDRELLAVVRLIDLIKELEIKMLTSEEKAAEIWLLIKRIYLQPIISEMKNLSLIHI